MSRLELGLLRAVILGAAAALAIHWRAAEPPTVLLVIGAVLVLTEWLRIRRAGQPEPPSARSRAVGTSR